MSNQPQNINFLSQLSFQLIVKNIPTVTYFCQRANIPGLVLGVASQPTYFAFPIPRSGDLLFNEFNITFKIDEELKAYLEIWNWMCGLGFPVEFKQYRDLLMKDFNLHPGVGSTVSDMTLVVLNNKHNPIFEVVFEDAFPTNLSDLELTPTDPDISYLTATCTFVYKIYHFRKLP